MRLFLSVHIVALLFIAMGSMAAEVEYQHPNVTIVAEDEPLESVLTTLGEEMRITVTKPVGLNPVIDCDIQNQPVAQAFKKLLGKLSYSLVWSENGDRLTGLVILSHDESSAAPPAPRTSLPAASAGPGTGLPVTAEDDPIESAPAHEYGHEDRRRAEREAQMAIEREKSEARMAEEREARELKTAQRRQEEEIAHEARMNEERERHEAEVEAFLESHDVQLKQ